jgi:hypothetical protein
MDHRRRRPSTRRLVAETIHLRARTRPAAGGTSSCLVLDQGPPTARTAWENPPHHGSRYTSVEFLNAVSPRAVLVSVGAGNRYRHPDPGLIGGLERAGAAVRRTDTAGDIALVGRSAEQDLPLVSRGSRRRGETGQHMASMKFARMGGRLLGEWVHEPDPDPFTAPPTRRASRSSHRLPIAFGQLSDARRSVGVAGPSSCSR